MVSEAPAGNEMEKLKAWRRRTKAKAVALMGGKCVRCGYDRCLRALQFHHKDKSQKSPYVGRASLISAGWSWERIKRELAKCELLCSNCHAEEEDAQENSEHGLDNYLGLDSDKCVGSNAEDVSRESRECGS